MPEAKPPSVSAPGGAAIALGGLRRPIKIYRDALGIPHVHAETVEDAFFGQGYAQAQDRIWQMDSNRMQACGRFAEYIGEPGRGADRLLRRMGIGASAVRDFEALAPEARAMLEAHAKGVNAFLQTAAALPLEYRLLAVRPEPWLPWHGIALFKWRHVSMGTWEVKAWRGRLLDQLGLEKLSYLYPAGQPHEGLMLPPGATYDGPVRRALDELQETVAQLKTLRDEGGGSNNWVLDGRRTASGRPLLAGDPHRTVDVPNVYYQNHIACPAFDAVGLSFPGLPGFPHFGHNAHVAWCVTHTGADTQDLFVERFDRADPDRYERAAQWRTVERKQETLHVRGGASETIDVIGTHHGPVIAGDPRDGWAVTLRYTATAEVNRTPQCLLPMLRSRSCEELRESLREWVDPVNNLLLADVDGDIRYQMRGVLPVRDSRNGWLPVPGFNPEHDWTGRVPYAQMPALRNPPEGMIVTANNRPVGKDYPHYIALHFTADYRARRVRARLQESDVLDVEDMASVHRDTVSLPALELRPLLGLIETPSDAARRAKRLLDAWDGRMDAELAAPAIYSVFREFAVQATLGPYLGPLRHEAFSSQGKGGTSLVANVRRGFWRMVAAGDDTLLPPGRDWSRVLTAALGDAVAWLGERLGPDADAWRWGALHQLRAEHPLSAIYPEHAAALNPPPTPLDGDGDTVRAAHYGPDMSFTVAGTSVARYVFDLADWRRSAWVVPHGSAGQAESAHRADQLAAWRRGELQPMLYDWDDVASSSGPPLRLVPKE